MPRKIDIFARYDAATRIYADAPHAAICCATSSIARQRCQIRDAGDVHYAMLPCARCCAARGVAARAILIYARVASAMMRGIEITLLFEPRQRVARFADDARYVERAAENERCIMLIIEMLLPLATLCLFSFFFTRRCRRRHAVCFTSAASRLLRYATLPYD